MFKRVLILSGAVSVLFLTACKSKTEDPQPKKEITINPASANVSAANTFQFSLTGNAASEAVTWSLDKAEGSISQSGLYTAPATVSASTTVTVTATLQSDNSVKSTATINLLAPAISFSGTIQPILNNYCSGCHSGPFASGDFRTNSYASFMTGGRVVAGKPNDSEVYVRITSTGGDKMPPVNQPAPGASDIELIRKWIEQGALNN